ncbi:hypothetical protein WN944_009575 [Citrus x changshan-huyou]|uniref:Uncharacterized protein n=1 Tax=Citrus x changshan-huyou TaxID=2935761 RepID=A0AAP0MSG7_9ROSI
MSFPELFCNTEELSLDGTAINELPSSIEYLSGLFILNLGNCSRLEVGLGKIGFGSGSARVTGWRSQVAGLKWSLEARNLVMDGTTDPVAVSANDHRFLRCVFE